MNRLLSILVLLALLISCHESQVPPLRLGVNPWVGYDPLILAREQAWFDFEQLQIVELMSATENIRALRNGLLDGAALTLDEALRLADSGVALKIIAILDTSHGADAVMARPEIKTLDDLKGKRIALEETALGALMLSYVLKEGGLGAEEVKTFHVEAAQHAATLVNNRADAVITFEPMKSQLRAAGFHSLFDSSQIPDEIVDVLVLKAGIDSRRTASLLQAWERGRLAMETQPETAAELLASGTDLNQKQYLATLKGLHFMPLAQSNEWLQGPNPVLIQKAAKLVKTLQSLGLLSRTPDWSALLGNGSIRALQEPAP